MCTSKIEKAQPAATGKALNTSDRTNYLADQIFNTPNYGTNPQSSQRLCKCGVEISRADFIFNRARSCEHCRATKSIVIETRAIDQIFTGRQFRLRRCNGCLNRFWHWRSEERICRECSDSGNVTDFLISRRLLGIVVEPAYERYSV